MMLLSSLCGNKAVAAAAVLSLLSFASRGAVADPPPDPQCSVFCFRITDVRCDPNVEDRFHFEFEVLNWSDAFAGGIKLKMNKFTDEGVEFADPLLGGVDFDNRPLIWEDLDSDGNFEGDEDDLEETINKQGKLDDGEDQNANDRLDNDPIPGNLRRNNTWALTTRKKRRMEWDGGPLPFINLLNSVSACGPCVTDLFKRDGPPFNFHNPSNGVISPAEWIDNGDNVQDGFVMTIDGLAPGKVVHMDWSLTGAGDAETPFELKPGFPPCRSGRINVPVDEPIGTVGNGNAYGFGLLSLTRLNTGDPLPGGTFVNQTGFRQTNSEFFDSVYNVPDDNGDCGTIGMEFTPAQICDGRLGNCKPIDTNGGGEPHFTTWSGKRFTFNGECDLVLIRNPAFADGLGMHVHGRLKIHEGGKHEGGWSDMEGVAVRIGGDVFEARGAHEYWINGQPNVQLPALIGGYQVSLQMLNARAKHVAYVIHLGGEKEIRVKSFDEIMWVQVKGQQAHDFAGSDGLLGHYGNGNMVARDGETVVAAPNDYAREWQVRPDLDDPVLFRETEGIPQYPQQCKMPVKEAPSKRLGAPQDEAVFRAIAEKACAHAPTQLKDDCVFDVVATKKVELAEAY